MRHGTRLGWWRMSLAVPLLLLGASGGGLVEEANDGMDIYFRDSDLSSLAAQDVASFPNVDAGDSQLIDRSFPDAPPGIPHSVEDMYPITAANNECLECHDPSNAVEGSDIPLPKTHFKRPVMGKAGEGQPMVWVVRSYEEAKDVAGMRYNCSMCHTPQSDNARTIASSFGRVKGEPTQ